MTKADVDSVLVKGAKKSGNCGNGRFDFGKAAIFSLGRHNKWSELPR